MQLKALIISLVVTGVCANSHGHGRRHPRFQARGSNTTKPEFGGQTPPTGDGASYCGNHGDPYGSNILLIDEVWVSSFKYVAQFYSPPETTESWNIVVWNKCGTDGGINGFFGEWVQNFQIAPNETKYVAFDEDSQGGWGAAPGSSPILNNYGSCVSTWGEFDFGNVANNGACGYDVSAIQAQNANLAVQGMQICSIQNPECSSISNDGTVINAYTAANANENNIAPWMNAGPVNLNVTINFSG